MYPLPPSPSSSTISLSLSSSSFLSLSSFSLLTWPANYLVVPCSSFRSQSSAGRLLSPPPNHQLRWGKRTGQSERANASTSWRTATSSSVSVRIGNQLVNHKTICPSSLFLTLQWRPVMTRRWWLEHHTTQTHSLYASSSFSFLPPPVRSLISDSVLWRCLSFSFLLLLTCQYSKFSISLSFLLFRIE